MELTPGHGFRAVLALFLLAGLVALVLPLQLAPLVAALAIVAYYGWRKGLDWRSWWSLGLGRAVWALVFLVAVMSLIADQVVLGVVHAWPALAEVVRRLEPLYRDRHPGTWATVVPSLLAWALVPALAEEAIFRGVLLQALRQRGYGQAVLGSAFLFAVAHGPSFLPALPTGLVLAAITIRSNSLVPAVILHFVHNGVLTLLGIAGTTSGFCCFCRYPLGSWVAILAVAAAAAWFGRRRLAEFIRWARSALVISPRQAMAEIAFLLRHGSVWALLALIILGIAAALALG